MVRARQTSEMPQPMNVKTFRRSISVFEIFCNANNHFKCIITTYVTYHTYLVTLTVLPDKSNNTANVVRWVERHLT